MKLKKTWKSPEWKKAVKEFVGGKSCEWCGSVERLTAHHPFISSYTEGVYLDLYLSGCIILCNRCHFSLHKGFTLCTQCKSYYCRGGTSICYKCYLENNPGVAEAIEVKKQAMKDKKKASDKAYREKLKASKNK